MDAAIALCLAIAVLLAVAVAGCAARSGRDRARVGALTVGESVLALDRLEQTLAASRVSGYDDAAQKRVAAGVLAVLHAARAYERTAAALPAQADGTRRQALETAATALHRSLVDLAALLPPVAAVREPLTRAIDVIRATLTATQAATAVPPVQAAQVVPLPQVAGFLALANLIAQLVASGRTSYARIKAVLAKEGATDEELQALDAQLTEAIDRRQAQVDGAPQ